MQDACARRGGTGGASALVQHDQGGRNDQGPLSSQSVFEIQGHRLATFGTALIDLRSDTVTKPTAGMRQAMADAEVGDDTYGEDPTARALEDRCAELFGAGGAVFTPTVTMANLIGLGLLTRPGDEIICDINAHIVRNESGAMAVCGGIQTRTTSDPAGIVPVEVLGGLVRGDVASGTSSRVHTAAVAIEQTHNQHGGAVYPLSAMAALRAFALAHGLAVHCDGARIWNAHVAAGVGLDAYGAQCDSIAVCFSKGLGCPAGAVLVLANPDAVREARQLRRRYGGSMRQAGILAAAGLYALSHHLGRLADDHRRARRLAAAIEASRPGTVRHEVLTNIVYLELPDGALGSLLKQCKAEGVLLTRIHGRRARLVTHLDIDDKDTMRAARVLSRLLPA